MAFLQSIFRRLSPARTPATPQVHLAAFGKHPGWNDHIDDLGLDTQPLVGLKRTLYVQGIGGNIDAGAWDSLDDAQMVPRFHHLFIASSPDGIIAGRLWSSSDGKGRTRYPMIAAAHCTALPLSWIISNVLPRLEQIESACTATRDAGAVRSILDVHRQALRMHITPAATRPEHVEQHSPLATLASHPDMGDAGRGLLLVLYQIEREWSALRPGRAGLQPVPRHLRVPLCASAAQEALVLWLRFLLAQVDPAVPLMVIVPLDAPWVDLIAGEPAPAQLFCFRATPARIPLTTQIPYTLDDEFVSRSTRLIAAAR